MRFTPGRFTGAVVGLALAALPSSILAQGGSPSSSAPAPPPASSGGTSSSAGSGVSGGGSSAGSGGSYSGGSSGGSSSYSGGSSSSGYRSGSSGGYTPSRGSYGGNHFDRPSGYAPGQPGRGAEAQPPARVELPGPRISPPGRSGPVEPGNSWQGNAAPPSYGRPGGITPPQYGTPGRAPFETPGRVEIPGRVGVPGVIGLPERPSENAFGLGEPGDQAVRDDGDTRLLPPPLEPGIGGPPVAKPVPGKPAPPPPVTDQPNNSLPNYWSLRECYNYGYGYYGGCYNGYNGYRRWSNWPYWGSSRHCYYQLMMMDEMEVYFSRMRGETWSGCYGYGDFYDDIGYYGYSQYNFGWMNLMPCAVVTAETYGGRKYSIVTMLPEFGAYGPRSLRLEIQSRLKEDGEITLQGRGSQELHLFDGFVKRVSTRYCYGGEW